MIYNYSKVWLIKKRSLLSLSWNFLLLTGFVFAIGICLHFYLLDGLIGFSARKLMGEDTVFATNYSEKAFRKIKKGMKKKEVKSNLGPPIWEFHWYAKNTGDTCKWLYGVYFDDSSRVKGFRLRAKNKTDCTVYAPHFSAENLKKVRVGMSMDDVKSLLGLHLGETLA